MYKHKTTAGTLLLALILCCLLSACGKKEQVQLSDTGAMILNSVNQPEDGANRYRSKALPVSDAISFVKSCVLMENEIIVCGEAKNAQVLQSYDFNGNLQMTYDLSWLEQNQYVSAIASENSDQITLVILTDKGDVAEYQLCRVYADGRHSFLADLNAERGISIHGLYQIGADIYLSYTKYDPNEYLIVKYSDTGAELAQFDIGDPFAAVTDGESIYVAINGPKGLKIQSMDCESGQLTDVCVFDSGRLLAARDGKIYIGDSTDVFCYERENDTVSRLFQWTSIGANSTGSLSLNASGQYIVWRIDGVRLVLENDEERKEIVLAINGMPNEFSATIIRFNDESDTYHISVKDYSQYADPLQTLATEMNAGDAPDLVDFLAFSSDFVNEKNLEDLIPYFNNDPDISTEDLLEGPLHAMMTKDGKLFGIPPAFIVWSITGSRDMVRGDQYSSVSERLRALGDPTSAFAGTLPRDTFLELAFCSQKTELYSQDDIAAILEYAAQLPEEYSESVHDAPQFIISSYESSVGWWGIRQYFGGKSGDMAIFGLPFFEGSGIMIPSCQLAIPKGAENKEGAWDFLKFMLFSELGAYSSGAYCPILKAEYERRKNENYAAVENGGTINDEPLTDTSHIEEFEKLIDNVSGVYDSNSTTYSVILSIASRYFSGQVDAQEAAADILSRLSLYYAERG